MHQNLYFFPLYQALIGIYVKTVRIVSLKLQSQSLLEKFNLSHPNPQRKGKINFNFHFRTSFWPLKAFNEGFPKPFGSPQRSVKIKI